MEANYLSYYLAYHYHVNELINHNWVFPILAISHNLWEKVNILSPVVVANNMVHNLFGKTDRIKYHDH